MARVVVTDGEQRAALAVVRSLGRAAHDVAVCTSGSSGLADASRYCSSRHVVPDPLRAPCAFAEAVTTAAKAHRADVVLPITEAALSALLPVRERLGATLPFASQLAFERVCDKAQVLERATALGIAVPRQIKVCTSAELDEARNHMPYPFVVKPSRSVVADGAERLKTNVLHVTDATSFARLQRLPAAAYPLLVQERIIGPGTGVFVLLWHGELIAAFAHRRLREKPPSGGVSVYSESQQLDPALTDQSVALLREFDWDGVAMVEYKTDARTGTRYLMEINGRFWGSLQLAISAGVDFPALLLESATGRHPTPVHSFRAGLRSRWLMGDVDHLLLRMLRSRAALGLPSDAPGRMRVARDFLAAFAPGSRNEILQWSDPMPAVRELIDWLRPGHS